MKYRLNGEEFDNQRDYRKALKASDDRNHAHDIWSPQDASKLIKLSETMSVSELADYFKRTELAIIYRLEKLVPSYEIQTEFHANGLKKNEGLYFVDSLYSSGSRKKEGLYFLDSLHGHHFLRYLTVWFKNGQIKSQGNYIWYADTPHGKKTEWYESGQKKSEGNYETIEEQQEEPSTIKVGKWTEWYENGQKKSEGSFYNCWGTEYVQGERLNHWTLSSINNYEDEISIVGDYDDDDALFAKIDKWTSWYENGQKESEGRYKDLYYDGKWTFWHENGQKIFEGKFKDGYQFGKHINWHENGQKKSEYFYKEIPEDKKDTFNEKNIYEGDSSGQIDISTYRQNFYLHGKRSDWDEDGQLTSELRYKNGHVWDGFWTKGICGKQDLGISQGKFKKGKKDGRWVVSINPERFDEDGNIIYLDTFLNNPLWVDEEDETYEDNFFKYFSKKETNYRNDKFHGKRNYWDSNGHIKSEENYKNDLLDGIQTNYKNGQIESELNYSKGVQQGKETWWHENGQIEIEENYKNGLLHGKCTEWDEKGQIESESNYKNDVRHGKNISWHENGQKKSEVNYKNGKQEGNWTCWHKNGQKSSGLIGWGQKELNFSNKRDVINAVVTDWYEGGSIKQETHYKNDEKHGTFTKWYESGSKEEEGTFKEGKKEGQWISWDEDGKGEIIRNYKNGVEIDADIPF